MNIDDTQKMAPFRDEPTVRFKVDELKFTKDSVLPITIAMNVVPATAWFGRAFWAAMGACAAGFVVGLLALFVYWLH
jgi:hypothetical protein